MTELRTTVSTTSHLRPDGTTFPPVTPDPPPPPGYVDPLAELEDTMGNAQLTAAPEAEPDAGPGQADPAAG